MRATDKQTEQHHQYSNAHSTSSSIPGYTGAQTSSTNVAVETPKPEKKQSMFSKLIDIPAYLRRKKD